MKYTINYIQDDIDDLLFDYCIVEDNKAFVNGEDYFDLLLKHLNECKLDGKQIEINKALFDKLGEVLPDDNKKYLTTELVNEIHTPLVDSIEIIK